MGQNLLTQAEGLGRVLIYRLMVIGVDGQAKLEKQESS